MFAHSEKRQGYLVQTRVGHPADLVCFLLWSPNERCCSSPCSERRLRSSSMWRPSCAHEVRVVEPHCLACTDSALILECSVFAPCHMFPAQCRFVLEAQLAICIFCGAECAIYNLLAESCRAAFVHHTAVFDGSEFSLMCESSLAILCALLFLARARRNSEY